MKKIGLALYCEGNSDEYFLPILIQRTSRYIVLESGRFDINIPPAERIEVPKSRQADDILAAAIKAGTEGHHILFVHADADDRKPDDARINRIEPGFKKIQETTRNACKNLVPNIPIQAIEAWMLADIQTLQALLDTKLDAKELGLPAKPALVEKVSNPKHILNEAVRRSLAHRSRRQRKISIEILYRRLAQEVRLEILKQVPAYKEFVQELTGTLKALELIQ